MHDKTVRNVPKHGRSAQTVDDKQSQKSEKIIKKESTEATNPVAILETNPEEIKANKIAR